MAAVACRGDWGSGHDGYPATRILTASADVWIRQRPVARVGDQLLPHRKAKRPLHRRSIASGASRVLVNGRPLAHAGSRVDCGGQLLALGFVEVG